MSFGCAPPGGPEFDADDEGLSAEDLERFGGETTACADCGEDVYDDAPFCHSCGIARIDDEKPAKGANPALVGGVTLVVVVLLLWSMLG